MCEQIWNIENKHLNVFQKIILITNFTNTTHFTLTNTMENYDHCFQKGSGNQTKLSEASHIS